MARRWGRQGSADSRCPACSVAVITQWVGTVAAVKVTAELTPLNLEQQAANRTPNRLIWCHYQASPHTEARLRWIHSSHPTDCPHPHLAEHDCPGPEPTTLF
jgi:hypothetical protein